MESDALATGVTLNSTSLVPFTNANHTARGGTMASVYPVSASVNKFKYSVAQVGEKKRRTYPHLISDDLDLHHPPLVEPPQLSSHTPRAKYGIA